jgi:alkylation response protein AidB-like acyl-CoA dehydrogenase
MYLGDNMALDLSLNESEEILKSSTLNFLRREVPKDRLQTLHDSDTGYTEEIWQKIMEMGLMGIIIPEQYGGTGYPLTTAGVLFEALGTGPLPGPYFSSGILGSLIILEAGSENQKQSILPDIAEGKAILALALTEPENRWDPGGLQTIAEAKGAGYVLKGVKLFTHDAQAATHLIVVARTGQKDDPSEGISLFLVDTQAEGVSVRSLKGYLAGRTSEVNLDSVEVTREDMLGEQDTGWKPLREAINRSIPVLCAYKVGGCQAVFDMSLGYSRVRVQFGQPIGRFQRVQDMIIETMHHTDAARWTTYEALWKLDNQIPSEESVHLAKAVSSDAYWKACTLTHRVISGLSYSMEHPLALHTRASRYLYGFLGEPAYHRQQLSLSFLS